MNLQKILQLSGVVATILLLLQFFIQIHRLKQGRAVVGRGRIFLNWLLVIIILVGFGGGGYLSFKDSQAATHKLKKVTKVTKDNHSDQVELKFKDQVALNKEGQRRVTFEVSPNTRLKIVGHYSKTVYKKFAAKEGKSQVKFHYTFDEAGTYDIIAERGSHKVTKKLVVKDHVIKLSANSSVSSSSSSSSVSSSNSSRPVNNTVNQNSNSVANRSYSGGRSYAGRTNSYSTNRPTPPANQPSPTPAQQAGANNAGRE
ncbi:hypothetical protein [uncultured Limosilactobacillus sp.]|uniref:hypothetical protein n=1 Tax=uncultured Limosilactobacillus sp. TaxID=2837629 RepID=UPI0025DEC1F9|nr:hypothetical protein [uncultured Limosilactobacillus sp.]